MIDLRSDTVTQPSREMLAYMLSAATGDDVYGEDPTVIALEQRIAALSGKESALFVSSGTQSNLLALLSQCERGDEYIAGQEAHIYRFEAGGGAVLGSIQPQPLPFNERGELELGDITAAVKPNDNHFARTRLVCLENTQGGKVLSMSYLEAWSKQVMQLGLRRHLDGARLFNAAVKLNIEPESICSYFDTVSICLSKSLACPVGSVLAGDKETIKEARRWRKMLGGGMRQAGILAAAGLYALTHHVDRLAEDHTRALRLASALEGIEGFRLKEGVQTNILQLDLPGDQAALLREHLKQAGILMSNTRWVIHRDISDADIDTVIAACQNYDYRSRDGQKDTSRS